MKYEDAVVALHQLGAELYRAPGSPRKKFRLEEMRRLAQELGDPQDNFPSILVAGTNGKGSTSSILAKILEKAGYRTGLYTSPHLERVNERIQLNSKEIPDEDFGRIASQVMDTAEGLVTAGLLPSPPSFFETLTATAFAYFAENKIDIAILEVGMGGRLDATNIVEPLISVITDISLDHQEWLGNTIYAIAKEKAGILRSSAPLVTLPQHPEANQAIGEVATELGTRGISATEFLPNQHSSAINHYQLNWDGEPLEVRLPLSGVHQQRNLALALASARELRDHYSLTIPREAVESGIAQTSWPGRQEATTWRGAPVLMDVAHNPAGAWTLRAALNQNESPRILVFGCLRDKAVEELAQILFPIFDKVVLTPVASPRAASLEEMVLAAKATGVEFCTAASPGEAMETARKLLPPGGRIVASGSVYLIGDIRHRILSEGNQ